MISTPSKAPLHRTNDFVRHSSTTDSNRDLGLLELHLLSLLQSSSIQCLHIWTDTKSRTFQYIEFISRNVEGGSGTCLRRIRDFGLSMSSTASPINVKEATFPDVCVQVPLVLTECVGGGGSDVVRHQCPQVPSVLVSIRSDSGIYKTVESFSRGKSWSEKPFDNK